MAGGGLWESQPTAASMPLTDTGLDLVSAPEDLLCSVSQIHGWASFPRPSPPPQPAPVTLTQVAAYSVFSARNTLPPPLPG